MKGIPGKAGIVMVLSFEIQWSKDLPIKTILFECPITHVK